MKLLKLYFFGFLAKLMSVIDCPILKRSSYNHPEGFLFQSSYQLTFFNFADIQSSVKQSPQLYSDPPSREFICTLCPKKFIRPDSLRKHALTHTKCVCNVCRQVFNDKQALNKHQVEVG